MDYVEKSPETILTVSVSNLTLSLSDRSIALTMPTGMRDALLNGQWDATGMLLDRFEEVRATGSSLPYVKGF